MVYYKILRKNSDEIVYEYYPEKHMESKAGLIRLDLANSKVELIEVAEEDKYYFISSDQINASYESMNKSLREEGLQEVEWEPLPPNEDCGYYPYASKAANQIMEMYNAGKINDEGYVVWY